MNVESFVSLIGNSDPYPSVYLAPGVIIVAYWCNCRIWIIFTSSVHKKLFALLHRFPTGLCGLKFKILLQRRRDLLETTVFKRSRAKESTRLKCRVNLTMMSGCAIVTHVFGIWRFRVLCFVFVMAFRRSCNISLQPWAPHTTPIIPVPNSGWSGMRLLRYLKYWQHG